MIQAKVVADSVSVRGDRLTSLLLTYPRFVHAELLTHRTFSRNTASNRAIPARRVRAMVRDNPVHIEFWGANQKGMSADEEVQDVAACETWWEQCRQQALEMHLKGEELGIHKQILNRILEPYQHITALVTATDWENFFSQRISPKAQPEIRVLATTMNGALKGSTPQVLQDDEWHLPFVTEKETSSLSLEDLRRLSVARCARLSYLNHDGTFSPDDDKRLYEMLLTEKHPSPFEHVARPAEGRHGNFNGWEQLRQSVEDLWQK